jgi:hypothetical protein
MQMAPEERAQYDEARQQAAREREARVREEIRAHVDC